MPININDLSQPITRLEHFIVQSGNGGGSLPEYTDVDAGKVLGLLDQGGTVVPAWVTGGGGFPVSCTFSVYYDEGVGDVVIDCDKSYAELSAILEAADAPVYSEVNYMGLRLYSVVYSTSSYAGDVYIGSPISLLMAQEHPIQGRVVVPFDAFVGRLSDNTPIVLRTPQA